MTSNIEYYYRYSASVTFTQGIILFSRSVDVYYHCASYPVTKRTQCGACIDEYGRKRFIRTDATKKWAAPTKKEAWLNYKARSKHALQHAKNNVDKIEAARNTEPAGYVLVEGVPEVNAFVALI